MNAWAIKTNKKGFGYIGPYWFTDYLAPYYDGCRIALFRTRAKGRYSMNKRPSLKEKCFPKAKLVKVKLSIYEI